MTKELFVSSTPHETKVGLVEDDQLAEIYLERENEYTLAGSIYKGRVTRVLPGMQSAFVDIGLERDAFLYVSDFMELNEHDDDVDEVIPAPPPVQELGSASVEMPAAAEAFAAEEVHQPPRPPQAAPAAFNHNTEGQSRDRGGWRGRRRRRGRHGEGRDLPDSRYARPTAESSAASRNPDHTPPPGYQPMILPGESISKYQRFTQTKPAPARERPSEGTESLPAPVASAFPEDEPFFAKAKTEPLQEQHGDLLPEQREDGPNEHNEALASAWEAPEPLEHGRKEYLDKDAEPGRGELVDTVSCPEEDHPTSGSRIEKAEEDTAKAATVPETSEIAKTTSAGMLEEEEIDEEEADLASYVEELEEDAAFEEMEEETRAAEDYHEPVAQEIAAAGVQAEKITPELNHCEAVEAPSAEVEEGDEVEEEEAELDEAQAEAEALVRGEAGDRGEVRAEVRAPAGTAGYVQRAQRPGFDRRRGRRGGRRFRTGRRESQPLPQISDLLKEGQEILVQIAKEPIGKKGARITSHIALPGRFLVYMPTVNHTGVSRKISSDEERMRLKRLVMSERENGHGGFIVRTAAQGASEEELRADIRFLKNLWSEIKNRAEDSKPPALIYHDLNVVERVLRDQVTSDFSAIWVDSEQEYERILRFANRFQPALVRRVKLYTKETPLFEQFNLSEEISKALKSKVWLKSGGYIVINQTEALVAIDVNTGKYVGKTARLEDTIVKTNVDAIKEIVRQVRLRDLGGIIVIDFIDMDERRNRQRVMQALEEALRSDRAPSKVLQFNDFGLVAITRKRVKQSLERTIGAPCPYCTGTGFVKSVATVCDEIYVEMRKLAKHLEHSDVMLRVNPEVAKVLKSNNGKLLNEMEELTKRSIIVKSDPALHQEQFDIN
jgi:Rne/Rng family ribonuclease